MRELIRTKWAAVGAAVAVSLGAGGISMTQAAISSGEKPVYVALTEPCRLVDTRPAAGPIGAKGTPIAAGETNAYEIQVTGNSGNCTGGLAVPADAVAVALNVTAIAPSAPTTGRSFFTVYPGDASLPNTSNLNFLDGQAPVPNKVDVGLSATGTIKIFNNEGSSHAAVDVFGYYVDHNHDDRYYTEDEVDTALGSKANSSDVYTKAEVDSAVATKDNGEADVDGGDAGITVNTTDQIVATVSLETPTSGYVIVNSGGYGFNGTGNNARCSITSGSTIDTAALQINTMDSGAFRQFGSTRGFVVNKALLLDPDTRTYNLVCDATSGSWTLVDPYLTAIFVPDPDAFGLIILPFSETATVAGADG